MIHWNFGYYEGSWRGIYPERLCPLTYFDNESRVLIEQIWEKTKWDYKAKYPLVCNGYFENKDE